MLYVPHYYTYHTFLSLSSFRSVCDSGALALEGLTMKMLSGFFTLLPPFGRFRGTIRASSKLPLLTWLRREFYIWRRSCIACDRNALFFLSRPRLARLSDLRDSLSFRRLGSDDFGWFLCPLAHLLGRLRGTTRGSCKFPLLDQLSRGLHV